MRSGLFYMSTEKTARFNVNHVAPSKFGFTISDLISCIEKTELRTRPDTDWFGGADTHHIYFEGMFFENGVYRIYWGS
jgi:hypothetical protein